MKDLKILCQNSSSNNLRLIYPIPSTWTRRRKAPIILSYMTLKTQWIYSHLHVFVVGESETLHSKAMISRQMPCVY